MKTLNLTHHVSETIDIVYDLTTYDSGTIEYWLFVIKDNSKVLACTPITREEFMIQYERGSSYYKIHIS